MSPKDIPTGRRYGSPPCPVSVCGKYLNFFLDLFMKNGILCIGREGADMTDSHSVYMHTSQFDFKPRLKQGSYKIKGSSLKLTGCLNFLIGFEVSKSKK